MLASYGMARGRLNAHYAEMRAIGVAPVEKDFETKAMLCLSGMIYCVSCVKASLFRRINLSCGPSDWADDALDAVSEIIVKRLLRRICSRSTTGFIRLDPEMGPSNKEWFRLLIAWMAPDRLVEGRTAQWLERVGVEEGWVHLTFATGIKIMSPSNLSNYARNLLKKPFSYQPSPKLSEAQNEKLANCLRFFVFERNVSKN